MNSKQRRKTEREFSRKYPYSYAYNNHLKKFANYDAWVKREMEIQEWVKDKKIKFEYKDDKIWFNNEKDYIFFMLKFV